MEIKQNNNGYTPTSYYPYGELPLKYTKQGQEQIKLSAMQGTTNAYTKPVFNNNKPSNENNNLDIKNPQKQNNNNFNLNTILPLFKNLGGKNDLIGKIMPMLNNGGNLEMNDLIKLFVNLKNVKSEQPKPLFSSTNEINKLEKID